MTNERPPNLLTVSQWRAYLDMQNHIPPQRRGQEGVDRYSGYIKAYENLTSTPPGATTLQCYPGPLITVDAEDGKWLSRLHIRSSADHHAPFVYMHPPLSSRFRKPLPEWNEAVGYAKDSPEWTKVVRSEQKARRQPQVKVPVWLLIAEYYGYVVPLPKRGQRMTYANGDQFDLRKANIGIKDEWRTGAVVCTLGWGRK